MDERGHLLPFPQAPDGIELRHLRAFVAVAEELSFARAADRLYLSAPALSRQVRGLEQLIGSELLRRSTHRVELTLAGEALLDRARNVLDDVDGAVSAAMAVGGELLSRVTKMWQPLEGRLASDVDLQAAREAAEEMQGQLPPPAGTKVRPVVAGGVGALVVVPTGVSTPTVIYLHGGAYVLGSAYGYRAHAGALAIAAQAGVLVPDYRLAPEHPFPAAVEDSVSAYLWLLDQGIAPEQVTLAGDSSGAGLALSTLLTLNARNAPLPSGVALFCPWLDLRLEHEATDSARQVLSLQEARRCIRMYLGEHPADDPIADPLSADLTGLPPMLVQAATGDARLADAKALVARAREHKVNARLELFPVEAHAFHLFWSFLPEAADAIEAAGAFIRERAPANSANQHRAARA